MKAKNKVSIFFLGVGERSSQKAFLSENVHTGVSLSNPQRLITDPPAGLWAAARLRGCAEKAGILSHSCPPAHEPQEPLGPRFPPAELIAAFRGR